MQNKKGFTLMEMLIVVAIIGILISIALPAFSKAFEKTRETRDLANIRSAMTELSQAAIFDDTSVAEGISLKKSDGDTYYQKIVYCTQRQAEWQSGDKDGKITLNGASIGASSYSKVPRYWYVRYHISGDKAGTFTVHVKTNK